MEYGIFHMQNNSMYMIGIYLYMGIFGLLGNIVTCIVIILNKSMQTTTNIYLFNLAISDLMILFWACPLLTSFTKYTDQRICIFRGLLAETSVYASVLTISAFSVERYLAICHPFLALTLSKISRIKLIIPLIWVTALIFASPLSIQLGIVQHLKDPNSSICTLTSKSALQFLEISSIVFFILPMLVLCVMYTMIGLKLMKPNRIKEKSQNKVLRMLVVVVVIFFICWAPFHIQRILTIHLKERIKSFHKILTQISGVLYYSSAIINPVIYNIMSKKYRSALKDTWLKIYTIFQSVEQKLKMIFRHNNG